MSTANWGTSPHRPCRSFPQLTTSIPANSSEGRLAFLWKRWGLRKGISLYEMIVQDANSDVDLRFLCVFAFRHHSRNHIRTLPTPSCLVCFVVSFHKGSSSTTVFLPLFWHTVQLFFIAVHTRRFTMTSSDSVYASQLVRTLPNKKKTPPSI